MSLEFYADILAHHGYAALAGEQPTSGETAMFMALAGFSEQQSDVALTYAQQAIAYEPSNQLYHAAVAYLTRVQGTGKTQVYASPEGFAAFIRGGGNVVLYQNTSATLSTIYSEYAEVEVLDIGVGDGLAAVPALTANVTHMTLVEPSTPMLTSIIEELNQQNRRHAAYNMPIQDFVAAHPEGHWTLAQATFSLQSLQPSERHAILHWLADHCDRLAVVEFDVPNFSDQFGADRVRYVLERYQRGIAEYPDQVDVIQGFLMPVMFGYFDRSVARTNYEQPIADWQHQLETAGFSAVSTRNVAPYWWADAWLLDAHAG